MTVDDTRQAVLGGFDGLSSAIGMIAALALAGQTRSLLLAAVALAVAAAVSMAAGEWLADPEASVRRAVVMGLATLAGSALPAAPFAVLSGGAADAACAAATACCAAAIAEIRPGGRGRSYALTFGVLLAACAAAVAASALAGGF